MFILTIKNADGSWDRSTYTTEREFIAACVAAKRDDDLVRRTHADGAEYSITRKGYKGPR